VAASYFPGLRWWNPRSGCTPTHCRCPATRPNSKAVDALWSNLTGLKPVRLAERATGDRRITTDRNNETRTPSPIRDARRAGDAHGSVNEEDGLPLDCGVGRLDFFMRRWWAGGP
jgi:hypothetical protein